MFIGLFFRFSLYFDRTSSARKGFLQKGMKVATIDHSIWFHRPFDLNHWHLHAIESNNAFGGRGLARGQIFSQDGQLIATTQQEGLIRFNE